MTAGTVHVWFSCGAASAVAAKLALERYGATHRVRILNNYLHAEDADNRRFLTDVETWLDHRIEVVRSVRFPDGDPVTVWRAERYMANPKGAPCTRHLKRAPRHAVEDANTPVGLVLGYTADERERAERFRRFERADLWPVLINAGLTKRDCFRIVQGAGLRLPRVYGLGYANANCIGCVKSTSARYWARVRQTHPEVFAARCEQSRELGARLLRLNGVRVFLDQLPATVRPGPVPAAGCGLFCEQ